MTAFDRLKSLCDERGISVNDLESKLGIGRNSLYSWKKNTPKGSNLLKVADYFDVSTDYLLGRTDKKHYYDLTKKDERDIAKKLEEIIEDMSNADAIAFSKDTEELSPEARAAILSSLEESLRIGKVLAKKKFTPKKYRDTHDDVE